MKIFIQALFIVVSITALCSLTSHASSGIILHETFEDHSLDSRITVNTVGTFSRQPGIRTTTQMEGQCAFGFGKSTCGADCWDAYASRFEISFSSPTYVYALSFKEREIEGDFGSEGHVIIDGVDLVGECEPTSAEFGKCPKNSHRADTNYRSRTFVINKTIQTIELKVSDITRTSEILLDDLIISSSDTYLLPPEQPQYSPSISSSGVNLVVLTHGWTGKGDDDWLIDMEGLIRDKVASAWDEGKLDSPWGFWRYDWEDDADTWTPSKAWVKARSQGKRLAQYLLNMNNLKFVHFIAHSAGSNVIHTAAQFLTTGNPSVKVHSTFLDAFTGDRRASNTLYGVHADWAEHYVDSRPLAFIMGPVISLVGDTTDTYYHGTTNFDVTALDPNPALSMPPDKDFHAWPYEFYYNSISSSSCDETGFALSYESGNHGRTSLEWLNSIQNLYPCSGTHCDNFAVLPGCYTTNAFKVVKDIVEAVYRNIELKIDEYSPTGAIWLHTGKNGVDMETGSPVWVRMKITTSTITDVIKFDYQFLLGAEGLLSVFFDDQLVYQADERIDSAEEESALDIPLPEQAAPGEYHLTFRLDSYNGTTSKISIKNIGFGKFPSTFPWRMFLQAMSKEN